MSDSPEVAEWKSARRELDEVGDPKVGGDIDTPGTPAYAANQRVIKAEKNVPAWKRKLLATNGHI